MMCFNRVIWRIMSFRTRRLGDGCVKGTGTFPARSPPPAEGTPTSHPHSAHTSTSDRRERVKAPPHEELGTGTERSLSGGVGFVQRTPDAEQTVPSTSTTICCGSTAQTQWNKDIQFISSQACTPPPHGTL